MAFFRGSKQSLVSRNSLTYRKISPVGCRVPGLSHHPSLTLIKDKLKNDKPGTALPYSDEKKRSKP